MKNQYFLKAVLMAALGVSPVFCMAQVSQRKQVVQKTTIQPAAGQPAAGQPATMPQNAMSPQEQQFAMKLSALHRQIFMMVFTPDLRKEAMALMTTSDSDMDDDETPMTQDMAVEEVISNHRDAMTTPMPSTNNQKAMSQQQMQKQPTKQQTKNTTKKKSYWD